MKQIKILVIIFSGMGQIDFTNIIIDDFRKGKMNPFNKYIYILTHIHSDHLRGLSNSWAYGPIYCSQVTANLIVNKFPKLINYVKVLPVEQPCKISLAQNIMATVTFFNANHCAGAVMVLLEGYFGRFLYTGDFRFDLNKFSKYSYLYPPENFNQKFQVCSRQIDKMWLDNTFCNPRFKFLTQKEAFQIALNFFKQNSEKKIYVGMDYYGKQQVLEYVSKQLDRLIVVDELRYQNLIAMGFDRELFTTNPKQGTIQVVQKPKLHDKLLDNPQALGLVMSGWCLKRQWRRVKGTNQNRIYYIPYSLHSNYQQIVSFVKSIKPSIIQPIVSLNQRPEEGSITTESMYNTEGNTQIFTNLVKNYTSPLSQNYLKNLQDKEFQQSLKKRLGLDRKSAEINKAQLGLNTIIMPPRGKGYKLRTQRNQQQIRLAKQQYYRSRIRRYQRQQVIINDDSNQDSSQIRQIQKQQMILENKITYQKQIHQQQIFKFSTSQVIKNNNSKQQNLYKNIMYFNLDWNKINKMQIIEGERNIQDYYKDKVKEMITNLM